MLTPDALHALQQELRRQRTEIEAALAIDTGDGKVVELDQSRMGRLSRMDALTQQEMSRATRARMQTDLRRVDAAIVRVAKGRYGLCCRCADPVEAERLQSDPATPFCLPCLEEMAEERKERERRR